MARGQCMKLPSHWEVGMELSPIPGEGACCRMWVLVPDLTLVVNEFSLFIKASDEFKSSVETLLSSWKLLGTCREKFRLSPPGWNVPDLFSHFHFTAGFIAKEVNS